MQQRVRHRPATLRRQGQGGAEGCDCGCVSSCCCCCRCCCPRCSSATRRPSHRSFVGLRLRAIRNGRFFLFVSIFFSACFRSLARRPDDTERIATQSVGESASGVECGRSSSCVSSGRRATGVGAPLATATGPAAQARCHRQRSCSALPPSTASPPVHSPSPALARNRNRDGRKDSIRPRIGRAVCESSAATAEGRDASAAGHCHSALVAALSVGSISRTADRPTATTECATALSAASL